ncbi:MAG: branched-chain amino acid ABC transporter permease [Tissierellia bacterium]|nr:branched-chain amino acid ABC transporter permease [Tissierellia bacterium]
MENRQKTKDSIKDGMRIALPIVVGYFPVAMAFGLLSKNTLMSFRDTSLLSIMVYAGASQFMAIDLLAAGVNMGSIVLATVLLNLRHTIMSASLAVHLQGISRKLLPIIAFGTTDETFSIISFNKDKVNAAFILTLNTLAYGSWVLGTMIGYIIGEILPISLQSSLGIGLYAMFAALLSPEMGKSKNVLYLSIISAAIYMGLFYSNRFGSGWDIILGILISSIIGVVFFNRGERN